MGKVIQMLSPENYIRKKARSLPIHECLVTSNWQEDGIAQVVVARKHTNGNITVCMYIVDLYCLGVKNTQYLFNISETEYREKKESFEEIELEPISYTLAHNIVFAGLEFAEEYGFKPHKDFTSITQYMLEEDDEDIELIEIECGKDGQPFFISATYDDKVTVNKVLAQLERTAGPGNYKFLLQGDEDVFDPDNEFSQMPLQEQRELFNRLMANRHDLTDEEDDQLRNLVEYVIDKIVDPELVEKYTEEYLDDFDFEISDDFTDEMLGIPVEELSTGSGELFMQVYNAINDDLESAKLLLADLKNETPENPAAYYLKLLILRMEESPEFDQKLQEYYSKYPDYPLLKSLWMGAKFAAISTDEEGKLVDDFTMKSLFSGRTTLHHIEAFEYLSSLILGLVATAEVDRIQTLYEAYNNLELTDEELYILEELTFIIQARIVEGILEA
jgi:hypothetical protein